MSQTAPDATFDLEVGPALKGRKLRGPVVHPETNEEIVIPLDINQGSTQEYVEDCPVCCRPNLIHVEIDAMGDVRVWSVAEQN